MPDVVLVHRISGLPRASFRFRLATDTLASGYALGATSCARDFHPLERAHAGHTKERLRTGDSRSEVVTNPQIHPIAVGLPMRSGDFFGFMRAGKEKLPLG